ncbi:T9SS type A sorting domain-containing protein [Hugenholtzia roseola]|uniref:T9SS type A sorting domain-containing protein n=1 Tax=Hugenholtzia roseola TaxID=1002 RepID=UPI0004194038|nr:T9SS type A sorting domain-containing protein [Hugenholtzia roseola]
MMMKRISLLWALLLLCTAYLQAQVTVTVGSVQTETFEAGAAGWTAAAIPGYFTTGASTFANDWQLGTPTVPAAAAPLPAANGNNVWATNLTGNYSSSHLGAVTSPVYDFSALPAGFTPTVRLSVFVQSENNFDGGQLQISLDGGTTWQTVGPAVGGTCGGVNWLNSGTFSGLTPPPPAAGTTAQWTGTGTGTSLFPEGWRTAEHKITGVAGNNNVRFRVVFRSDTSVQGQGGLYFDNFSVDATTVSDIVVTQITAPVSGALTNSEIISFSITNNGSTAVTSVDATYTISGPSTANVTQTLVIPALNPCSSTTVSFTTPANLSATGTYTVDVTAQVTGQTDANPANNTVSAQIVNVPTIATFPYYEDFEANSGSFISSAITTGTGITPSTQYVNPWEWGAPSVPGFAVPVPSGQNAWATRLNTFYPDNALAAVTSPLFDFTGFTATPSMPTPRLFFGFMGQFQHNNDGGQVQISLDGGTTWAALGTTLSGGLNWYNRNTALLGTMTPNAVAANLTQTWTFVSGTAADALFPNNAFSLGGGWVLSGHPLPATVIGQNDVRFRMVFRSNTFTNGQGGFYFDDVKIVTTDFTLIAASNPTAPTTGTNLTNAENITFTVTNQGSLPVTSITVTGTITGPANSTFNQTVVVPAIAPNATATITLTGAANLSVPGEYQINLTANVTGQTNLYPNVNSVQYTVIHIPTIALASGSYTETFETNGGSWIPGGTTPAAQNVWQWGAPTDPSVALVQPLPLPSAPLTPEPTNEECWGTIINGQYPNSVVAFLESPIFDFTGITTNQILLFDFFHATESCCDGTQVQISFNGGTTYQTLGTATSGVNWYNNAGTFAGLLAGGTWRGTGTFTPLNDGWFRAFHPLPAAALGNNNVRFRFAFRSDVSATGLGAYVDNIYVGGGFYEGGIVATEIGVSNAQTFSTGTTSFIFGTELGLEDITVPVQNNGSEVITSVDFEFNVQGPNGIAFTVERENVATNIDLGDTEDITLADLIGFTDYGYYTIQVNMTLNDGTDIFAPNNTAVFLVENVKAVAVTDGVAGSYREDFEITPTNSGWYPHLFNDVTTETEWEIGTPSTATINGAASGQNAWVTNLNSNYGNDAQEGLISPFFDFTSLNATTPAFISFANIFDIEENFDGGVLAYVPNDITGAIAAPQLVGTFGQGVNWYNNPAAGFFGVPQWDGNSTDWRRSTISLAPFMGTQGRFIFLFGSDSDVTGEGWGVDDILIANAGIVDLGITAIPTPNTATNLIAVEPLQVQLQNFGTDVVNQVAITYELNGAKGQQIVTENATISLAPGAVTTYQFLNLLDVSFIGDYNVKTSHNLANDLNPANNELDKDFTHLVSPVVIDSLQLKANLTDSLAIIVEWIDESNQEIGFVLQRATDPTANGGIGNWQVVTVEPANDTSYLDLDILLNGRYFYRAQYLFANGLSGYSNVDTVDVFFEGGGGVPVEPYEPILAATPGYNSAVLTWNMAMPEQNVAYYEIYGYDLQFPSIRVGTTTNATYTVTGLINGVKVGFYVRAVYRDGSRGNFSNGVEVTPSIVLGEDEVKEAFKFQVFPNPNTGTFQIALEGKVASENLTINITDLAGKVIYSTKVSNYSNQYQAEIALPNVAAGLYLVQIATETETFQQKVSIVR